jgi:tetratricopeptide (TPR) repeat protein
MIADQLQSHLSSAQELLQQNRLDDASREAELAVDQYWMTGDSQIAAALPLLSTIRHATGGSESLFSNLDDLPKSLSDSLVFEAARLHEEFHSEASSGMLSDVNEFLANWIGEEHGYHQQLAEVERRDVEDDADEKIEELIAQIEGLKADGRKKLAVEVALELANEYTLRKMNRKACRLYKQILRKSKRYELTELRIDGLLDFGQFFSQLGMLENAERVLRLAAGVARKASDRDRYSHVLASLGVVLAHAGKESAEKYLQKASSMLSPWDAEAEIVNRHLESIRNGESCDCPATPDFSDSDELDWD